VRAAAAELELERRLATLKANWQTLVVQFGVRVSSSEEPSMRSLKLRQQKEEPERRLSPHEVISTSRSGCLRKCTSCSTKAHFLSSKERRWEGFGCKLGDRALAALESNLLKPGRITSTASMNAFQPELITKLWSMLLVDQRRSRKTREVSEHPILVPLNDFLVRRTQK
jgi:hypothetical protein